MILCPQVTHPQPPPPTLRSVPLSHTHTLPVTQAIPGPPSESYPPAGLQSSGFYQNLKAVGERKKQTFPTVLPSGRAAVVARRLHWAKQHRGLEGENLVRVRVFSSWASAYILPARRLGTRPGRLGKPKLMLRRAKKIS